MLKQAFFKASDLIGEYILYPTARLVGLDDNLLREDDYLSKMADAGQTMRNGHIKKGLGEAAAVTGKTGIDTGIDIFNAFTNAAFDTNSYTGKIGALVGGIAGLVVGNAAGGMLAAIPLALAGALAGQSITNKMPKPAPA